MKASETRVEDFLSNTKTQFVIPVYQRNYDWSLSQCKQLLNDIFEIGSNRDSDVHFIGSIVYVHDDVYTSSRIKELTIIDGQQRLTTLTLIYLVLYRIAIELEDDAFSAEINETYLINKFASDEEKLKLRPTEKNNEALRYLYRGHHGEEYREYSKLIDNFNFFREEISEDNYEYVLKGLSKLMFVEISLDREKDNPQRIFESLNSTGLELSQADLIRNYILMGLNPKDQEFIYSNYWKIIEGLARNEITGANRVSDFIRDYLTLTNKKIPNKNKVYLEFKNKYPTSQKPELIEVLDPMKSLAKFYNKLLNPMNEIDRDIRTQLEYINRLEINVAYPFLMKVYEDYASEIISKNDFLQVLEIIQSFTFRRFIVGLPTNALNKIFMTLYGNIDINNYVESLQSWLIKRPGTQRFPRNNEVIDVLKLKDVYNIKSKNRTYLLERLENFQNKEPVMIEGNADITIEHIFPQNPDPKWKVNLKADEYISIKENYLHTLANLTLSGNNGKLGNKSFEYKRDLSEAGYKDSRLWLNKFLSTSEKWGQLELEQRFEILKDRFLQIWEYPDVVIETTEGFSEVNIFEAEDPKFKKLEYAVFFDNKMEVNQVAKLYIQVIKDLFELQPEIFFTTELGNKLGITKNPQPGAPRQAVVLNDTYYIEGNIDNTGKFDRIKLALKLFDKEDELFIKYAD